MTDSKLKVQVLEGLDNKLDLAKLKDVLKRKLIIPSYQRPYAWKPEHIEEIFQTINMTKDEDSQKTSNNKQDEDDIYFFGSIILSKKGNGFGQEEYYIIDGQQRLSSFLLILRVILNELDFLLKKLESTNNLVEQQIERKIQLNHQKDDLSKIIEQVKLTREKSSTSSDEKTILNFIKKGGEYESLPDHLKEKIDPIYSYSPITHEDEKFDPLKENKYIDEILEFLDHILNRIRFCLICITGKNSEDFAINLFNTLNTTGQPLTAFEVLKSELYTMDKGLSDKIDEIQSKIITRYIFTRKKIVTHTGKLLLYLALYRGDFKEDNYTLSDNKFKDQRSYLKQVLSKESAEKLVKDIQTINDFYSDNWLKLDSPSNLLTDKDAQVCFQFLSESKKHDRVLPILIRFDKSNTNKMLGECVKICTAFSGLWIAYFDGSTSGIDKAYKDLSSETADNCTIDILREKLKDKFLKKLSSKDVRQAKEEWMQKMQTSTIYKNQKLSKLFLFLAYNQRYFDDDKKVLGKGKGINILDINYWKDSDYKTIEHIIPQSGGSASSYIHTLGNLTLLPQALNLLVGNKSFPKKREKFKQFCSKENDDKYPYIPIIRHIASYDRFEKKDIEERSKILSKFIWQTLAEDWLGWKD